MNFKKTKVEVVKQKNPFPSMKVSSDAAIVYSPFVVKQTKVVAHKGRQARLKSKKLLLKA